MARIPRRGREPNDLMKEPPVTLSNFDRLAKGIMERHQVNYSEAREMLSNLQLGLIASEDIKDSRAHQAALLTAINTGKRAFRGGVAVSLPPDVPLLLPWPGAESLESVAESLGANVTNEALNSELLISF